MERIAIWDDGFWKRIWFWFHFTWVFIRGVLRRRNLGEVWVEGDAVVLEGVVVGCRIEDGDVLVEPGSFVYECTFVRSRAVVRSMAVMRGCIFISPPGGQMEVERL